MPKVNVNSINSSISYAETIADKVLNDEIIYSFFLGNVDAPQKSPGSEERRQDVFTDASFFKKLPNTAMDVVVEKNDFEQKSFNTWNAVSDTLENFYCYHNGNVYLIIGNNENNTTQQDGKVTVSTLAPPTHTYGIQKKAGYEYLFLFSTLSQDEVALRSDLWIPTPKASGYLSYFTGSLLQKRIDIDAVSSINFSYDNPTIPILSDTGSGATITLVTIPTTKAGATKSRKRFKIIGIQASPGVDYLDFDLEESLASALPNESAANLTAIENAITIGFTPLALTARKILQANHTLITAAVTSTEIKGVTDQTQFFGHGLVEGIEKTDGTPLFTKSTTTAESLKGNNVQILTPKNALSGVVVSSNLGLVSSNVAIAAGASTNQKGKLASSKTIGNKIFSEVQVGKNPYVSGTTDGVVNTIKAGDNAIFVVLGVTAPPAKEGTGTVINIADTNYSISGDGSPGDTFPKTFVTQYLNRYN